MRTTITLDPDVALLVEREMAASGAKFKDVVNQVLRRGLNRDEVPDTVFPTARMGRPLLEVNYNHLAADLEDDETLRKLAEGR